MATTIATTVSFPCNGILIYIGIATGYALADELMYFDYSDPTTGHTCLVTGENAGSCVTSVSNVLAECDIYNAAGDECDTCAAGYYWETADTPKACTTCGTACYACTSSTTCDKCTHITDDGSTCGGTGLDAAHDGECLRVIMAKTEPTSDSATQ